MSSKDLDLNRYAGFWYEISRNNNFKWEKDCHYATAEYTWIPSRKILTIKNNCLDKQRNIIYCRSGEAKIVNKREKKLKVVFNDGLPSDVNSNEIWNYRVLYTDYEKYSIVTSGINTNYIWILSRTPSISSDDALTLLNRIKSFGFDETKLISKPSLIYN